MNINDPIAWPLPMRLPANLSDASAAYATAGVAVFPCVPGGKRPLTKRGFHDASTDPRQVARWWDRVPTANIGIPTGSLVDVLDVDVHAAGTGFPILHSLQKRGLVHGWGQAVRSPSGGLHLYYPADPAQASPSWSRGHTHVDFRSTGGYIIAPPSTVTTDRGDRGYEVIALGKKPSPVDAEAIRDFLTPQPIPTSRSSSGSSLVQDKSVERIADWVALLPEGNRNAGLFWAACRLAEAGMTELRTTTVLGPAATRAGLASREIAATIRSAHHSAQVPYDPGESTVSTLIVKAPVGR